MSRRTTPKPAKVRQRERLPKGAQQLATKLSPELHRLARASAAASLESPSVWLRRLIRTELQREGHLPAPPVAQPLPFEPAPEVIVTPAAEEVVGCPCGDPECQMPKLHARMAADGYTFGRVQLDLTS